MYYLRRTNSQAMANKFEKYEYELKRYGIGFLAPYDPSPKLWIITPFVEAEIPGFEWLDKVYEIPYVEVGTSGQNKSLHKPGVAYSELNYRIAQRIHLVMPRFEMSFLGRDFPPSLVVIGVSVEQAEVIYNDFKNLIMEGWESLPAVVWDPGKTYKENFVPFYKALKDREETCIEILESTEFKRNY